jgi:hypothetical protein
VGFAGAALSLWLVREREIERTPLAPEVEAEEAALPEALAA